VLVVQINYGFYRHEWIEELQELSLGDHAHLFRSTWFLLWKASPGDTGERFGVIGKRDSFQATSSCSGFYTTHFSRCSTGDTEDLESDNFEAGEVAELLEGVQAVVESVLDRGLTEGEEEELSLEQRRGAWEQIDVGILVESAVATQPAPRTRAECNEQRMNLTHKVQRAVCGVDGAIIHDRVDRLVELRRQRTAKTICDASKPTTNPYQRSAAKWLANSMGLPACVAPVATNAEYELFMSLYMKLSDNGKRGVDYKEMCAEWNALVVSEMEQIQSVSGDLGVDQLFDRLRLKTSCQLSAYAGMITDRYHGVKALQPYLDEYKRLCHELKQHDADEALRSPQVGCTAPSPRPIDCFERSRTTLPLPSNLAASQRVRPVIVKSVALEPAAAETRGELQHPKPTPPAKASKRRKATRPTKQWKLELCSQCYIRHNRLEPVYVEFGDGRSSKTFHNGRQNGGKVGRCPRFASKLTVVEKDKWKVAMRQMQRDGRLQELYDSVCTQCAVSDS